jgi:hypothetical protein
MAGVLDFQQYVGGADQIKCEQWFPSNRRTLIYNFQQNITGWTFTADFQTIVVDTVSFARYTGQPNFANSTVIGSFAKQEMSTFAAGIYVPTVLNVATGTVRVYQPDAMYTGPIIPDARKNVPITVFALTWTDANSPITNVNTHRFALVQCWEPDVDPGDPTLLTTYIPLVVA